MKFWYQSVLKVPALLLSPLTLLTLPLTRIKRSRRNRQGYTVPIVVVGNITVGGTGKTPMIVHLTRLLQQKGIRVGVVSRGYGAKPNQPYPVLLAGDHSAEEVGDEPLLIARSTGAAVVIAPDRHQAVEFLLSHSEVDVIISDDGLQHYRMARDVEIVMIDGLRALGNGLLLPAGPLREESSRLATVDFIIAKQQFADISIPHSVAKLNAQLPVNGKGETLFAQRVKVCSGIGNFESFLSTVESLGFTIVSQRQYRDHQPIASADLCDEGMAIVITEKDYVKLSEPSDHIYYLPLSLQLSSDTETKILNRILEKIDEKSRHHSS